MTRLLYGGQVADVFMVDDAEGDLVRQGGATALFYNAQSGGDQIIDLLAVDGATPISSVQTSLGGDGWAAGQLPMFYGPDGVFEMWISVNDSPRQLITAANLGSYLGPVREQLDAHLAASNVNPHRTGLENLVDVDFASIDAAPVGSVVVKDASGLWVAGAQATGGGGTTGGVTVDTDQTITGSKTFNTGEPNKTRVFVRAATTGQIANILEAWSGTDTGQGGQAQKTTYLNEKGELRVIAAKSTSVAVRVKGQPGQTANILEITDTSNNPKAWFAPNYSFYAPNIGRSLIWTAKGALVSGAGVFTWTNDLGVPVNIRSVRAKVGTAPGGQSIILDVKVNGTSIYSTAANRPTIAAGSKNSGRNTGFSNTVVPDGGEVTVDIAQVGASGTTGADLGAQVEVW